MVIYDKISSCKNQKNYKYFSLETRVALGARVGTSARTPFFIDLDLFFVSLHFSINRI